MRRTILIVIILLAATMHLNCRRIDREEIKDNVADVTVIFCGMPERVEPFAMEDLAEVLRMRESGEIGQNVCMAGMLKFGESSCGISWHRDLEQYGYDGTLAIDLGERSGHEIPSLDGDTLNVVATYLKELHAERFAGRYFRYFDTDSLACVIRQVADEHPARNYVLCMLGHGCAQYCMRDDYYPGRRGITAEELEDAVKKSGVSFNTLFLHCCLTGTIENLSHYRNCAQHAILSSEETCGGYIAHYIANLSKSGGDPERMDYLSRETVDFYAEESDRDDEIDTSLGFYDMSGMDDLLCTVKDINDWYDGAMASDSLLVMSALSSSVTPEQDSLYTTVILADLMRQTISLADSMPSKTDISLLTALYERYMSQLKDMAYIRCNHTEDKSEDHGLLYASPSITHGSVMTMHLK